MVNHQELHVIFGTGPVGRAIAHELLQYGKRIRMVNSSGRKDLPESVEHLSGDAKNPEFALQAAGRASHVYFALNPAYHRWEAEFPILQENVLRAAIANSAKLIAVENLYMYGDTHGKSMSEDMPYHTHTRKGKVRAKMHEALMAAHASGKVQVVAGRSSDFFGPFVKTSAMGDRVFGNAVQGKAAQIIGKPDVPHTQTYIADIGKALVMLARAEDAYGEAWHIPSPRTVSQREFLEIVFRETGGPLKMSVMPNFLLHTLGIFVKPLGEMIEMLYEFEAPFSVDTQKFERKFGNIATPLEDAIRETVAWYRRYHQGSELDAKQLG